MHPLDNPFWNAMNGSQRHLTVGGSRARRYKPGLGPQTAVLSASLSAYEALKNLMEEMSSEEFHLVGTRPPEHGVRVVFEVELLQMVAGDLVEVTPPRFTELDEGDVPEMLELAAAAQPGPFRSGSISLGRFIGIREDGRLVAMAGERAHLEGYREITAVCTRPEYRRRGYARGLTYELAAHRMRQGETPFLHVEANNHGAIGVYERMGFVPRRHLTVTVLRLDEEHSSR